MVRPPALSEPQPADQPATTQVEPSVPPAGQEVCAACGAMLAEDQEWCLECGVARTRIEAAPDWRIGVAIMLGVVALVLLVTIIVWP